MATLLSERSSLQFSGINADQEVELSFRFRIGSGLHEPILGLVSAQVIFFQSLKQTALIFHYFYLYVTYKNKIILVKLHIP